MKITDKLQAHPVGSPLFSFEFGPTKKHFSKVRNLLQTRPSFVSVTWGAGRLGVKGLDSLSSAISIQQENTVSCLHINTVGLTFDKAREILNQAKDQGIKNLFVIRGDKETTNLPTCPTDLIGKNTNLSLISPSEKTSNFEYASDLVSFIVKEFPDIFCIGVGAYPEKHPESCTKEDDIRYLKEKVDKGANFIITQYFFNTADYVRWVKDLRSAGITIPIIPLVMLIKNYTVFERIQKLTKVTFPDSLKDQFEAVKTDPTKVENLGVQTASQIIRGLQTQLEAPELRNIHLSTLNNDDLTLRVLRESGLKKFRDTYVL